MSPFFFSKSQNITRFTFKVKSLTGSDKSAAVTFAQHRQLDSLSRRMRFLSCVGFEGRLFADSEISWVAVDGHTKVNTNKQTNTQETHLQLYSHHPIL